MPSRTDNHQKKEKKKSLEMKDQDLLTAFLMGKFVTNKSPRFQMVKTKQGAINLLHKDFSTEEYHLFAQYGKVNDRVVLLLDPKYGDSMIIARMFTTSASVHWFYRMLPLTIERAMAIHNEQEDKVNG